MDIEKRVSNLEKLVDYLSKQISNNKFYTDADIAGTRQSVTAITPYTDTATAYIDDAYVIFENVPAGNMSVFFDNPTDYVVERNGSTVLISFEPLEKVTVVTISIQ